MSFEDLEFIESLFENLGLFDKSFWVYEHEGGYRHRFTNASLMDFIDIRITVFFSSSKEIVIWYLNLISKIDLDYAFGLHAIDFFNGLSQLTCDMYKYSKEEAEGVILSKSFFKFPERMTTSNEKLRDISQRGIDQTFKNISTVINPKIVNSF